MICVDHKSSIYEVRPYCLYYGWVAQSAQRYSLCPFFNLKMAECTDDNMDYQNRDFGAVKEVFFVVWMKVLIVPCKKSAARHRSV